jgi:S-adenosylmethionine hydrolase
MEPCIVMLTDFGTHDPFVGIMKGVITGISPGIQIIDLCHEIPPGDIQQASIALWQSVSYFPQGTIFLVVVDPGVGTHRRPLIIHSGGNIFIGPDNGIFTFIMEKSAIAWELENSNFQLPDPMRTFHGRDIFAPAAAYAARGIQGFEFGKLISKLVKIPAPRLETAIPGVIFGETLHTDRFGNILTSLGVFKPKNDGVFSFFPWVGEHPPMEINLRMANLHLQNRGKINWALTFEGIPKNQCAFIVGSSGLIEIVSNQGNAARLLGFGPGNTIELHFPMKEVLRRTP